MMRFASVIFLTLSVAFLSACSTGGDQTPAESALETAVAATMQAMESAKAVGLSPTDQGEETATATLPAAPEPPDLPTPLPPPEQMHVVYTDSGNLWLMLETGTPRQLTDNGKAISLRLSTDGAYAVYLWHDSEQEAHELRAVATASGEEQTLLTQGDFDGLYSLEGLRHVIPSQFEFVPGTHQLLFNTGLVFDGPGQAKNDDLHLYDLDAGTWTTIFNPGDGGDFTISPNAGMLALVKPDSVGYAAINGAGLVQNALQFEPVITYSEFRFYPLIVWSADSSRFLLVVPSPDPFGPDLGGAVWSIPVDGSAPTLMAQISGQTYFPQLSRHALVSSDLQHVAFLRDTETLNVSDLYIANLNDGSEVRYANGGIEWAGWHPDGARFLFGYGPMDLQLGSVGQPPSPLVEGTSLRWVNDVEYLYLAGEYGHWTLMRGRLDGGRTPLVSPAGNFVAYDFAR